MRFLEIFIIFAQLLRVNVSIIQSDAEQGSIDLANFHMYSTVFHADHRGVVYFS